MPKAKGSAIRVNRRAKGKRSTAKTASGRAPKLPAIAKVSGGRRAPMPAWIQPELASLVRTAPEGKEWLHEIKFDGYRILARIEKRHVELWSRNKQQWTTRFVDIASSLADLPVKQAWLDGEVVAFEASGVSSFQSLQNVMREKSGSELVYQVFDLLYVDGYDLRVVPLEERKNLLSALLSTGPASARVRYTEHILGDGRACFQEACRLGLEGIISKNRQRGYVGGRGADWVKVKCGSRDEFVIGGFTEPSGSRAGFGSLLIGYYDDEKQLHYAGRVGTGFSDAVLIELRRRLGKLEQPKSPFVEYFARRTPKATHWVKPQLVAEVAYNNWTRDRVLRHPAFLGLREDKPAGAVRRDVAAASAGAISKLRKKAR